MNKVFIFLFTLGLIYFARFEQITVLFQKIVVPLTFLFLFLQNYRFTFKIGIISLYILFILLASTSFVHTINFERTLRFFQLMVGSLMLIYIYVFILIQKPELLRTIAYAFIVAGLLFVFSSGLSMGSQIADRESGITSNPNLFGMFMLYTLFGVALLWKEVNKVVRLFLVFTIMASFYGIIVAASRKSLLSAGIFIVLWTLVLIATDRNFYKALIFIAFGLLITYISYYQFYLDSVMMYRLEYLEESGEGRVDIATEGLRLFKFSPLIGLGLGTFQEYSYYDKYAHNDFFELIATLGIIGFLIYSSIYYWLIKLIRKLKHYTNDPILKYKLNLFLIIIITMVVLGLGRPHFFDIFSMSIFGIMAGYASGLGFKIKAQNES